MAYFDPSVAAYNKRCKESFDELMKFIKTLDKKTKKVNKFYLAAEYIKDREIEMEKMQKEISEYRNFFKTLRHFLPEEPSIYDIIK